MKLIILFLAFMDLIAVGVPKDTTRTNGIYPSGISGLNVSQISFTNWSQGGENSLTWSVFGNFSLKYVHDSLVINNRLHLTYGKTKTGDDIFKTNSNDLLFETVFLYRMGWSIDPYFSNNVRTVITKGYDYSNNTSTPISNFFDPGYITQSLGFSYNKSKEINTRLGIAIQETFTNKYRHYSDDPTTPDKLEAFKYETGLESVTESEINIHDNIVYIGRLRLFTRFEHIDVWDVRFDNNFAAKISSLFNVNLTVLLIYEKDQSLKTQLKQGLQLGISYTLF